MDVNGTTARSGVPARPGRRGRAALALACMVSVMLALGWWLLTPAGGIAQAALLLVSAVGVTAIATSLRLRARLEAERGAAAGAKLALHLYELLARHSRDVVLQIRRDDGRILEANAAATVAYGWSHEELLARTIFDLRASDPDRVAGQIADADVHGLLFEALHRRKDGSVFPVEVSSQGATMDGARVLISVIRDITERRRAEEALRHNEQRLRGMFDHAGLGIVEVDADDRFVAANARVCEILGYRTDELLGMSVHELTAPEDRARSDDMNARLRGPEDVIAYEKRYLKADGAPVWVHVTVSAVRDASGSFVRGIGTVEDIGARKAVEAERERLVEALRDADRKKDEFLGILSHELRNPLAPIRNSIYLLKHADPAGPQASRARDVIDRQTSHMTRLVDDLLDVTRIARGKIDLRRERVDLAEVVSRTGDDHRSLMTERDIELSLEIPGEATWVDGDATRLAQIVGNLLQNAAKFTAPGGTVTLGLRSSDGWAEVAVRDTGVGIEPRLLGQVFDPFVQAERTLARSSGGLGLGLALVKGLTELHGGTVSVSSDGAGRGSEFRIAVPLLAAAGRGAGAGSARGEAFATPPVA
jgi:PAS domain S-box-containing protein